MRRWWRRDGTRRNCGGELDCWPMADAAAAEDEESDDGAAAPLNFKNLLLLIELLNAANPPPLPVIVVDVMIGPDIWTSRKKARCCEQHLYNDLHALFDGVSKPYVLSSFWEQKRIN